jgi:hypothetical protein
MMGTDSQSANRFALFHQMPGGPISCDPILVWYDGPQLFLGENASGQWHVVLAHYGDDAAKIDDWLVAPITEDEKEALVRANDIDDAWATLFKQVCAIYRQGQGLMLSVKWGMEEVVGSRAAVPAGWASMENDQ